MGRIQPTLAKHDPYRVALVGDAPEEKEVVLPNGVAITDGHPFSGSAGFRLTRLLEWAGLDRGRFDIWPAVWCHPPDGVLEGASYESAAVEYWKQHWHPLLSRVDVVVPMGNVALSAFLGHKGILKARGYCYENNLKWNTVLPTVHPSFIQRGMSKYSAAFINDVQKAVSIASSGQRWTAAPTDRYVLDPTPEEAYRWALAYRSSDDAIRVGRYLSFDIETPDKDEDESEWDPDTDPTYFIWRVGFAYNSIHGERRVLSVPWTPEYIPTIKLCLDSPDPKIVWNAEFDVPRVRHNGVEINGIIHDGMVAWHILHSDLPKGLGFVATFTCPDQPAWKHLSTQYPDLYNAMDADVELRSFLVIEAELKRTGLWAVYQRDVVDLAPILIYMQQQGMPINQLTREDRAIKLADRLLIINAQMEQDVPLEARRIDHVFKNPPTTNLDHLHTRPGTRDVPVCPQCGTVRPRKDHFKTFVRKVNPCAGLGAEVRVCEVTEYYRLAPFTPSRDQLIRYHNHLGRPLPTTWDKKAKKKKVSFNEKAINILVAKYPQDMLYSRIKTQRTLTKVAGTYIGKVVVE